MHRLWLRLVLLFSLLSSVFHVKPVELSLQQRAAHSLIFLTQEGNEDTLCSGTAVGPHVLMTAKHCFTLQTDTQIKIDLSTSYHQILAVTSDNRDHILIGVDGAPFTYFIDLSQSVRSPKPGEKVYMYGDGGGHYPPRPLYGKFVPSFDSASEVDQNEGIELFSLDVIAGDSGAAVYGQDGSVLGLVTYKDPGGMAGFALNFSQDQISVALHSGEGKTL